MDQEIVKDQNTVEAAIVTLQNLTHPQLHRVESNRQCLLDYLRSLHS